MHSTRSKIKKNINAALKVESSLIQDRDSSDSDCQIIETQSQQLSRGKFVKKKSFVIKSEDVHFTNGDCNIIKSKSYKSPRKTKISSHARRKPREISSQDSSSECEEIEKTIKKNLSPSPRKQKLQRSETSKENELTPPKQRRVTNNGKIKSPLTPSHLLDKLDLNCISENIDCDNKFSPKKLFSSVENYQYARRALHSSVSSQMPGRERELEELKRFILTNVNNEASATLYISGPPGTGKTASLSNILQLPEIKSEIKDVYVNCTGIKSAGSIYSRIVLELGLKSTGKTEREYLATIENYLGKNKKTILLVLDEIDQLDSKKQSILYTIFEWPSKPKSNLLLIGIANALDLTDRILPRLQARCELKPKLMHFAPYSKQQIVDIFTERLKAANVSDIFSPVAIQMLAGKVSAISGDVRRALDIGRRVVELAERHKNQQTLQSVENIQVQTQAVDIKQVVNVLNNVYGTSQNLIEETEDSFPLQQKIIICSLLLLLRKAKNKDITVGKLHDVYRRVCSKRNILSIDQAEFFGLCSLVETRGILRVQGRQKEPRMCKVLLEWDEEEVAAALNDKQLMSSILQDVSCLGKI